MIPVQWSTTPADNGTADSRVAMQEGIPVSGFNNGVRGLMASAALSRNDSLGTLVATLGANNVYSLTTNETIVDPKTTVNGLTPAITKPFTLKIVFDKPLAGSATNAPKIAIDGAAAVPLLRRDGSVLADGDLPTKNPVEILGDMAAQGDANVTRVRLLGISPGELVAAATPVPAFPVASETLTVADLARPQYAAGGITLTMPAAYVGWTTGSIYGVGGGSGLITLAVPTGATLDGVTDGATVLRSLEKARIIQVAAAAYITEWETRFPALAKVPNLAGLSVAVAALPAGWSAFEIDFLGLLPVGTTSEVGLQFSTDGGFSFDAGAASYYLLSMDKAAGALGGLDRPYSMIQFYTGFTGGPIPVVAKGKIYQGSAAQRPRAAIECGGYTSPANILRVHNSRYETATAINALQIVSLGGPFAAGFLQVTGAA